jgi:hypothetical protein
MWAVESVTPRWQALTAAGVFGHQFTVRISMRHTPNPSQHLFDDPPSLIWRESITQKEFHSLEFWRWEGDLYGQRPGAATFKAWRQRYVEAYNAAINMPTSRLFLNGSVELVDAAGRPIRIGPTPGQPLPLTDEAKAVYMRRLILKMECVLHIEIDDRPALANNVPNSPIERMGRRRERLLLFECGAGARLIRAAQHLVLDQYIPTNSIHLFNNGWSPARIHTAGFNEVPCPSQIYRFESSEITRPDRGEFA